MLYWEKPLQTMESWMEYHSATKKEWSTDTGYNTDEFWKHYAK